MFSVQKALAKEGRFFDFRNCPFCDCGVFYRRRDFPSSLGCLVLLIGAVLVPWTYGLSLAFLAGVDYFLRKKIGENGVCYQCRTDFGGFPIPASIKEFDHHVGIRYDHWKGPGKS